MRGAEFSDLELLLHLARALPSLKRLRIQALSLLDAELSARLARLRREQGTFDADVRPGLLGRLRRRPPHPAAGQAPAPKALPARTARAARTAGFAAAARRTWARASKGLGPGLTGRKAVYLWVALSTLTLAVLLLSPLSGGSSRGAFGLPAADGGGSYARPPLILGY